MTEETPVLSALAEMTAVSIERGTLPAREHMLARLAALVAVGAPPVSYVLNAGTASDVGITLEDVQGILVAIAPIVGTPQIVSASANRSEEHTSELQSRRDLVCRLLLEKKNTRHN